MRHLLSPLRWPLAILTLCAVALTSACDANAATPATPTATPIPTCASLLPGSNPATAGQKFPDVAFPANSLSTPVTLHSQGTGLFSIYLFNVCSPNTTTSAVKAFFATGLPGQGWAQAPTLPFDGGVQKPCGDPYCWSKDTHPRMVGLEKVTDAGNQLVTYTIRLFTPPPTPNCPYGPFAGPNGPYVSFYANTTDIPLPPLTETGPGDGFDQGGFSQTSGSMCSAGTATSLNTFFATEMPAFGWAKGSPPAGCVVGGSSGTWWRKGSRAFKATAGPGSFNPGVGWDFDECEPQ